MTVADDRGTCLIGRVDDPEPTFVRDGAERLRGAVARDLARMRSIVARLPQERAGLRLADVADLRALIEPHGSIGTVAAAVLGPGSRAVRALLFDKTATTNWSLAWHQDRTICVRERIDVPGFGPWTVKDGKTHVAPPATLLARMVTVRVHLDDVPTGNAPLLVAPGSHALGRVPVDRIREVVERCGTYACLADAGDVWLYATPILHASDAATSPTRRRVLQLDFAAEDLPGGLTWLGV